MFVIADAKHVNPSYIKKIGSDNISLITISLSEALLFKTSKEAKDFLSQCKPIEMFEFGVY